MSNKNYKNFTLWIALGCFLFLLVQALNFNNQENASTIPYSEFISDVEAGKVSSVMVKGTAVEGHYADGRNFVTYSPGDARLVERLLDRKIRVEAASGEDKYPLLHLFLSWLPLIILCAFWFFAIRQMQTGGSRAMSFGKSKAKLLEKKGKVTFNDVAGVEEAKDEVKEIVDFLKDPHKFKRLGGKIPRGVLLVGPPGTGKTLLARAIAGEANVPFFSISGSEFVEMFVGVGASRVRDLFDQGKRNAPCIIFIDEIDAVGRHRGFSISGGNDEREQTLNQLLVEMDGFEENSGVIIISATNRPDVLDPALLRPGRFDRQVVVPLPDINGREKILKVHLSKVPLSAEVDPLVLARGTSGFSGADLASLVNEAALLAARRGKRNVGMDELEDAQDKVMMGSERRSMVMTEEDKKLTAYHEAGHAIVALNVPGSDPIHKATIIPRGRALGMVVRLPENDRVHMSKQQLEANLAVAAGGRVSEELIFGSDNITTGASSDIEQATRIAKQMIMNWGMSDKLGFLSYGEDQGYMSSDNISPETLKTIDNEVRELVDQAYQTATKILKENRSALDYLAQGLLEHETLSEEEIRKIIDGQKIEKKHRPVVVKTTARSKMPVSETSETNSDKEESTEADERPKRGRRKKGEPK